MNALDTMINDIEDSVKKNPSLRALHWWNRIMDPEHESARVVKLVMEDVCKRNPQVVLALKEALVMELDMMLRGEPKPEIE